MQTINVIEAFVLTLDDHTRQAFAVGRHEVEDFIADHWYVKAHTDKAVEPDPAAKRRSASVASASASPVFVEQAEPMDPALYNEPVPEIKKKK